jgi:hypothetical protein
VGFLSPISDTHINVINAGKAVPLVWQLFIAPNVPNTGLTFCSNRSGTNCTAPWVNLGTLAVTCPGGPPVQTETILAAGNSGLQNFGNGSYQFNWQTVKGSKGCVKIVATFDSGLVVYPATFQYK